MIQEMRNQCDICEKPAPAPRGFKLTIGTDRLRINHSVQVDTMLIENGPVRHMVDIGTHFCAAGFTKTKKSKDVWALIQ